MRWTLLALYLVVQCACACELEFAYLNQPSLPFISASAPDEALPGVAIELVRAAAQGIGCKARFVRRPGKRVLAETAAGMHAGALMYSFSIERARKLVFPMAAGKLDAERRMARLNYYLYRPVGGTLDWDGKRLLHVNGALGVNLGYAVADDLRALGARRIEEVGTTVQNLEKMRMGRIDGFAMHDYGVDPLLRLPRYAGIEKVPPPLSTRDYYLALSPRFVRQEAALAQRLWDAIAQQREAFIAERLPAYLE